MRCAQPFIPIASERLGKQILELRCFRLADFSKHIADKYNGAELGKFKFPTLALLQRVSSSWNVFNTTQIFKTQVISAPPSTTQLNLNFNIVIYLNTVVQRFLGGESKPQNSHSTRFSFSNNSTISITKTWLSQLYQRVHIGLTQKERILRQTAQNISKLNQPVLSFLSTANPVGIPAKFVALLANNTAQTYLQQEVYSNTVVQRFVSRKSKPHISQSGGWTFSQSSTILLTRTSLPQLNQLENMEVRQKERTNQAVLSFQNKSDAFALGVGGAIAIESPGSFGLQQSENNTLPIQNLQLEKPASPTQIFVSSPSPTFLTEKKKPVLIHLLNMNQITSTIERTSQLIQRLQNADTQSILQYRKVATNSITSQDDLSLAPHHIRTRRLNKHLQSSENLLSQQVDNTTNNSQQKQNSHNTLTMEFVQPKANIFSIPNNQENKTGNHQEKKVKVKNDLIKQVQTDIPTIDVNHIAEQVYQLIERKIKIERQRRGML